jgi:hypothetical protein
MSGPYAMLANVAALIRLLRGLEAGANPLDRLRARALEGGQVALRVFPSAPEDRLVPGYTAEVWLRPAVSMDQAKAGVARRLRDPGLTGSPWSSGPATSARSRRSTPWPSSSRTTPWPWSS